MASLDVTITVPFLDPAHPVPSHVPAWEGQRTLGESGCPGHPALPAHREMWGGGQSSKPQIPLCPSKTLSPRSLCACPHPHGPKPHP